MIGLEESGQTNEVDKLSMLVRELSRSGVDDLLTSGKQSVAAIHLFTGCNVVGEGVLAKAYVGQLCSDSAAGVQEVHNLVKGEGKRVITFAHVAGHYLGGRHRKKGSHEMVLQ